MVMADTDKHNDRLDLLFAQAQRDPGQVPPGLTQRILADAEQVQAGLAGPVKMARRPGPWRQFLSALGGWPTIGGLVTACAAGVWIGLAPPSFLPDPALLVLGGSADIDLIGMDGLVAALAEEG